MSRTHHHQKRYRGDWGSKRLGNKWWNGIPGPEQKKITMHRERMAGKESLIKEIKLL